MIPSEDLIDQLSREAGKATARHKALAWERKWHRIAKEMAERGWTPYPEPPPGSRERAVYVLYGVLS